MMPNTSRLLLALCGALAVNAQNVTATVNVGNDPYAVAVNPVTNKIYVANQSSNTVTVIDGATNSTTTVNAGNAPFAVAVNPVTNKIYVANYFSDNVTVMDGSTNSTATIIAGGRPAAVVVNLVTNKIYVANQTGNDVTVIDGLTNSTATINAGNSPFFDRCEPGDESDLRRQLWQRQRDRDRRSHQLHSHLQRRNQPPIGGR
jgi:YVTN family beta-propeller protein